MRCVLLAAAAAGLLSSAAAAVTIAPVMTLTGSVGSVPFVPVSFAIGADGLFRGGVTLSAVDGGMVSCDGSVIPSGALTACDGSVVPGDGSVRIAANGSIDPFIAVTVGFLDSSDPTDLIVSATLPILTISGLASTALEGYVDTPGAPGRLGSVDAVLPSGKFFESSVNGVAALELGDDPIPQTESDQHISFGPIAGVFDCDALPGDCSLMTLTTGVTGLGGGQKIDFGGRFDLDATTPVPLPATALLLVAALGSLPLLRRRV